MSQGLPLSDIAVVELAHVVAGPACGLILAELGADVLKIEPEGGDISRRLGPRLSSADSALYLACNRGKRTARLGGDPDVRRRRLVEALERADVFVTNLSLAQLESYDAAPAALRARHPELIVARIMGGPEDDSLATDSLAQARMGLMGITGPEGGPGFRSGAAVVDVSTGVWTALGVLTALRLRQQTGTGQHLTVNLGDVCLSLQFTHLAMHAVDGGWIRALGNHSPLTCTPVFSAADGRFGVTLLSTRHWRRFSAAIGRPELVADGRFQTEEDRRIHQGMLEEILDGHFAGAPRARWVETLAAAGVPCAPQRSYDEVLADEDLAGRRMLFREAGSLQVRLPLFFDGQPLRCDVEPD